MTRASFFILFFGRKIDGLFDPLPDFLGLYKLRKMLLHPGFVPDEFAFDIGKLRYVKIGADFWKGFLELVLHVLHNLCIFFGPCQIRIERLIPHPTDTCIVKPAATWESI